MGLGFSLPKHIDVKLYHTTGSFASGDLIRLHIGHVYARTSGEYRFIPKTPLHEMFHVLQFETGAPESPSNPLLDWFWEGPARFANRYLNDDDDGSGYWWTYFGSTPDPTSFWDLSQTLEHGSYHFGGRFWRFLTHNWAVPFVTDADREAATHHIFLPRVRVPNDTHNLRYRRGVYLLQDALAAVAARVAAGTCAGDECFRAAVDTAIAGRMWDAPGRDLLTFDTAYRAYASENVRLEGPGTGNTVAHRFLGKFKGDGAVNKDPVDQAVVATYSFTTPAPGHYTIIVTGVTASAGQNPSGDDDDLRFELDGQPFGSWNSADAFDGDALASRAATRFLRTNLAEFAGGLPAGPHVLTVYGDEQPHRRAVRVVPGLITPVVVAEPVVLSGSATGTAPGCPTGYGLRAEHVFENPALVPMLCQASATLSGKGVTAVVFAVNGAVEQYPHTPYGQLTYSTDAPQTLKYSHSGGVPETLRGELSSAASTTLIVCATAVEDVESATLDSLYVHDRPLHDTFVEIHGALHEYSTHYEIVVPDPTATAVEISLVGDTSWRFLTVTGEQADGTKVDLSDVWNAAAAATTATTAPKPSSYSRLVIGVGAYGFQPWDPSLTHPALRQTLAYTLRVRSTY